MLACCKAKYILPGLIGLLTLLAFRALDLVQEFRPAVYDILPNNATELYAIVVPPAYSGDGDAQREPLLPVLGLLKSSDSFYEATKAAADSFVNNVSTTSVSFPIECSFQLYKVDEPPDPNDMWTARGILIHAENYAQAKELTDEFQANLEVPIQVIRFGPGAYVHGNHPLVPAGFLDLFIFGFFEAYWVESLITLHWETFDYQDKFVVMRIELVSQNAKEDILERQHVVMKADSLDVYEKIYPELPEDDNSQGQPDNQQYLEDERKPTKTRMLEGDAIYDEL